MRILLIHGAATTSRVWRHVVDALRADPEIRDDQIVVPDRPQSGDLTTEVAALARLADDALVVGVSGGATLGLELAARGVPLRGALLHEPAAGSLVPGLLAGVGDALKNDGVRGFGTALYGPAWNPAETTADRVTVAREFAMFGEFEPRPLSIDPDRALVTTGANSPPRRHDVAAALAQKLRVRTAFVPDTGHAVHLTNPAAFAALISEHVRRYRDE